MKIKELLKRLQLACNKLPVFYDVWYRGLAVLERKFNLQIYLSGFKDNNMVQSESPEVTISIKEES